MNVCMRKNSRRLSLAKVLSAVLSNFIRFEIFDFFSNRETFINKSLLVVNFNKMNDSCTTRFMYCSCTSNSTMLKTLFFIVVSRNGQLFRYGRKSLLFPSKTGI